MLCGMEELHRKEVVNIETGEKLGRADDLVFDTESARLMQLVILGRYRFFGLLGREEDILIPWEDISVIGEDTILVKTEENPEKEAKEQKKFRFLRDIWKE